MKCFEINLLLYHCESKQQKDIRQYFHQPLGPFQAIQDAFTWIHLQVKKKFSGCVIDRLAIWEWEIATPSKDGNIGTKRLVKVLNWSYEKGVSDITGVSNKQRKKVFESARFLNKYRHIKSEILIEEIGQELLTEGVTCIAI